MNELIQMDATELVSALEDKRVSSAEVVEALHAHADVVEPAVGAFTHQFRKRSLAAAQKADSDRLAGNVRGPLHGLPVTIKDSIATAGVASTLGMRAFSRTVESEDAVVVQGVKRAGGIVLGKTNVPQSLLAPLESTNELFGQTNNPWSVRHAAGGSSGGEGAAIASGMSPLGIGTDIGGSIRSPAVLCGVTGLKPTVDRISNRGCRSAISGQEFIRAQCGPMARSVRDLRLLMSVMTPELFAELDPRVPPLPATKRTGDPRRKIRVGFYEDDGYFTPAASVRRAVREAAAYFEKVGVEVVRFSPPNVMDIAYAYLKGIAADGSETLIEALDGEPFIAPLRTLGRLVRTPRHARLAMAKGLRLMGEDRMAQLIEGIGEKSVKTLWALTKVRNKHRMEEISAWDRAEIDVLLAPALVTPAVLHGESHDFTLSFVNLARYNYLDLPAGAVPITRVRPDETNRTGNRDRLDKKAARVEVESMGLPVGIQLIARPWQEELLLDAMEILESQARSSELFPRTPEVPHVSTF